MTSTETTTRFEVGDRVLLSYCEGSLAHDHWSGPATVVALNGAYGITLDTEAEGGRGYFDVRGPRTTVTPLYTSTVVHDAEAMAALPAGTITEDVDGDITTVTEEGGLYFETLYGSPSELGECGFGLAKYPVEVLNPEILDEPEVTTYRDGFKLGDTVTILTDDFKALARPGDQGTVEGFSRHGGYIEVTVGEWWGFPFDSVVIELAYEPLADWELELINHAEPEVIEFQVGDTVIASKDAGSHLRTWDAGTGYVYEDAKGATGTVAKLDGSDGNIDVYFASIGFAQLIAPRHLTLAPLDVEPEVVSNDELIGATVEDEHALDTLSIGSVLLTPYGTGNARLLRGDGWYSPYVADVPVLANDYLTVLYVR